MTEFNGTISVLYSQVCVFDPEMESPYNEWTEDHNRQGFSWRKGSVSFATSFDGGEVSFIVEIVSRLTIERSALCIIKVPFTVPVSGHVECGSIMSGILMSIDPGEYCLMFSDLGIENGVKLSFMNGSCDPEVIKHYGSISPVDDYVMEARAG